MNAPVPGGLAALTATPAAKANTIASADPSDPAAGLVVRGLDASYGGEPVLRSLSFRVRPGELLGVIGPNGGGKTTLLRSLLGLVPGNRGQVLLHGRRLRAHRQRVAYVPQQAQVDWDYPLTVAELVAMGAAPRLAWWRRADPALPDRLAQALAAVDLIEQASTPVSQLSGGQRQRAMLARALMAEAVLVLLDEPFAGVDLASQALIWRVLEDLQRQHKSLLLVHHELNEIARADRLLLVSRFGAAFGAPQAVLNGALFQQAFGLPYAALTASIARGPTISPGSQVAEKVRVGTKLQEVAHARQPALRTAA